MKGYTAMVIQIVKKQACRIYGNIGHSRVDMIFPTALVKQNETKIVQDFRIKKCI